MLTSLNVDEAEVKLIARALEMSGGNRTRAADLLGISVRTLRNKLNGSKVDRRRRRRMRIVRTVVSAMIGGVLALGCRTPSSVGAAGAPNDRERGNGQGDARPHDWPAPAPGRTFTLMPTPKTVAWGWYDAAGEPVLRVGSRATR